MGYPNSPSSLLGMMVPWMPTSLLRLTRLYIRWTRRDSMTGDVIVHDVLVEDRRSALDG